MIRWFFAVVLSLVMMLASCSRRAGDESAAAPPASDPANAQVFQVKGVVVELLPEENSVRIKHEEIPGYMAAMTMVFEVRDPRELAGLAAGDSVAFRLLVTDDDGWIDQVRKLPRATSNAPPTTGAFRLVRDVEPLRVGEVLPEYRFTNQLGRAISTSQFRGRALAITFIFTRCPFPTFCPRMMENFAGAQRQLLALASGPTNWHLLTLSIDPEFDTPAVLKPWRRLSTRPAPLTWRLARSLILPPWPSNSAWNSGANRTGASATTCARWSLIRWAGCKKSLWVINGRATSWRWNWPAPPSSGPETTGAFPRALRMKRRLPPENRVLQARRAVVR